MSLSEQAAANIQVTEEYFLADNGANVMVVREGWAADLLYNVTTENFPVIYMNAHHAVVTKVGTLDILWWDLKTDNRVWVVYDNVCVVPESRYNIMGWNAHCVQYGKLGN